MGSLVLVVLTKTALCSGISYIPIQEFSQVKWGGEFVVSSNAEKLKKAVTWPVIVWVIAIVLFRLAALIYPPAGSQFTSNFYPIATTLGLLLAVWAGFAVKAAKGTYQEAIVAGVIVGLACAIPGIIIFGLEFTGFAINITIFSMATAWAGWGLK
jgi:hypothetical protein